MLLSLLYRVAFLLLAGLACSPALAELDETYGGLLTPESFEAPIPITIQLKEQGGRLTGTVSVGSPFNTSAPIVAGENRYGQCTLRLILPPSVTLRMSGGCQASMFEGRYTISSAKDNNRSKGTFRLMRKDVRDSDEDKNARSPFTPPAGSVTDCIKANTRCLLSCPQGDYNTEFLCSNRCRHKYQACKAKFSTMPSPRSFGNITSPDAGMLPAPSR